MGLIEPSVMLIITCDEVICSTNHSWNLDDLDFHRDSIFWGEKRQDEVAVPCEPLP